MQISCIFCHKGKEKSIKYVHGMQMSQKIRYIDMEREGERYKELQLQLQTGDGYGNANRRVMDRQQVNACMER